MNAIAFKSADEVLDDAIRHVLHGSDPAVVVKSPPGAGKTFLVECAAVAAAAANMRVVCVTPGVSQAYDVVERLLAYNIPRLELVHAKHRQLPEKLRGRIVASSGWNAGLNVGPGIVVANAHVLASYLQQLPPGCFDLAILDEAYQIAATTYLPIAALAARTLMVGDPGQLPPVTSIDTSNMEVSAHPMHWPMPEYLLKRFRATPTYGLPVTRRLLPDSARTVQAAFYPELPFASVVDPSDRKLSFNVPGVDASLDPALDAIAAGASLVGLVLPGSPPANEDVDMELAATMARVAERLLMRQAEWVGQRRVTATDIGCIDPNVLSGGAVSERLRSAGLNGIRVETAERWQGLQIPISIVRHPLSRPGAPIPFDLQAGRWCVSLSRHQIACIVVARHSIEGILDTYVHACNSTAAGGSDHTWTGFQAHRSVWSDLQRQGRIFYV